MTEEEVQEVKDMGWLISGSHGIFKFSADRPREFTWTLLPTRSANARECLSTACQLIVCYLPVTCLLIVC